VLPGSVLDLFADQYSLVGRHQLRERCSTADRRRITRHPDIERATPRVLRHRAGVPDLGQQLLLPVLDAGRDAALWGRAAAHWWGFGRFRAMPAHVVRRSEGPRPPHIGVIHVTRVLDPGLDLTVHRGIPIVRPERLLLWLARVDTERYGHEVGALRLERTLDHAWREGLVDGHRIHAVAERCAGKGNSGIVILRQLLEDRPPDHRPTDSGLERRWEEVVGADARSFRRQVVLGDDAPIGRFDQVHASRPLVVEIHSEKFHTMPSDRADDARRACELVAAGFCVVVYWEYDIWHDAATVRRSLREVLARPHRAGVVRPTPAPYDLLPASSRADRPEPVDPQGRKPEPAVPSWRIDR
jgi:very-short-patch-repair endonuclease